MGYFFVDWFAYFSNNVDAKVFTNRHDNVHTLYGLSKKLTFVINTHLPYSNVMLFLLLCNQRKKQKNKDSVNVFNYPAHNLFACGFSSKIARQITIRSQAPN